MNATQQRIVARMNEYGIKQAELAKAAGFKNQSSLSSYLNSERTKPEMLVRIEKALEDLIAVGGRKPLKRKAQYNKEFPPCNKNCQFAEKGLCTILTRADDDCTFFKAKEKTA